MQLAVPQRPYPSCLNHTPRPFELRLQSDLPTNYRSAAAKTPTQTGSGVHIMASPLSVSPVTALPASGYHPFAPRNCASFTIDRPTSSVSRRHSWTSFSNNLDDLQSTALLLPEGDDPGSMKRKCLLTRPGATFDMAYFLKNTGPPVPPTPSKEDLRRASKKKSLAIFRKRKEATSQITEMAPERNFRNFVSCELVEQKVTQKGQRYLQIVANSVPVRIPEPNIGRSASLLKTVKPKRLSATFSDRTDTVSTEALDSWVSTFSIQRKEADYSVKPPTSKDLQILNANLDGATSRRSCSFVSDARSWLPGSDSGFGMSMIDEPLVDNDCSGASEPRAAFGSNPPSNPRTPEGHGHPRSVSIQNSDRQSAASQRPSVIRNDSAIRVVDVDGQVEEKEKYDRRSVDVLAGQGMRRPTRDQDHMPAAVLNERPSSSNLRTEHERDERLSSERLPYGDGIELLSAASIQLRRNRDAAVRARKIRELQRAKQNIDAVANQRHSIGGMSMIENGGAREENSDKGEQPMDALVSSCHTPIPEQLENSKNYEAKHESNTDRLALTPVTLISEQVPLPRGRQIKKPARLVLPERGPSKHLSIAVRAHEDMVYSPALETSRTQISISPQESTAPLSATTPYSQRTFDTEQQQHQRLDTPTPTSKQTPSRIPRRLPPPSTTPPGLPPPSQPTVTLSRTPSQSQYDITARTPTPTKTPPKYLSAAQAQNTLHVQTLSPRAVTATTTTVTSASRTPTPTRAGSHRGGGGAGSIAHRTSVCSSAHTSTSREARLEARLEALERENRLLEAALMAVLKTSGTLNGCPCVLLSKRHEAGGTGRTTPASSRTVKEAGRVSPPASGEGHERQRGGGKGSQELGKVVEGNTAASPSPSSSLTITPPGSSNSGTGTSTTASTKDTKRRHSAESLESEKSGVSALDVYLGTRLGN